MGAILRNGFETGGGLTSGIKPFNAQTVEGVVSSPVSGISARKDFNGNGGNYFFDRNDVFNGGYMDLKRAAVEGFARIPMVSFSTFQNNFDNIIFSQNSNKVMALGSSDGTKTRITLNNNSTLSDTLIPFPSWVNIYFRYYIDSSNGYIKVFSGDSFSSESLSFSGNTTPGGSNINRLIINSISFSRALYDDLAVNDITMSYNSGTGTLPSVGSIILGQTSGTRAVITQILDGSTSSSGTLQLAYVRDSGMNLWNGIISDDPFLTEVIDDSLSANLWSASIVGLDKNSGFPLNSYIIGLSPNADVAGKIQLSRISGSNNYENVDDIPANNTNYVYTDVSGDRDIYEVSDFPISSSSVGAIKSITVNSRSLKAGSSINKQNLIIEHSGVEYDGSDILLDSNPLGTLRLEDKMPNGDDLTVSNIDSIRIGIKFKN